MPSSTGSRPALLWFVSGLSFATLLALFGLLAAFPPRLSYELGLLAVLAVLAEGTTLTVFRGGTDASTSYPFTVAAVILSGPFAGAAIGALGALLTVAWRQKPDPLMTAFNVSQVTLADAVSAWTYVALGGPVGIEAVRHGFAPSLLIPLLGMTFVGPVVNIVLLGTVLWLAEGKSPLDSGLGRVYGLVALVHAAMAAVGVALAEVTATASLVGIIVFVFPLFTVRQIYRYYARLQEDYPATVRALVGVIEAKDEYTKGHSLRVADFAVRLARHVGMSERNVEEVEFAALLHDLGKMTVRAEVLTKPGRLTDEEFKEMRAHPVGALGIVSIIPGTERLIPVIRHHHERIDGRGYPDGIMADGIPFNSKLLAVCDTYDAMTSSRPYRSALPKEAAMTEIQAVSGTQLDPALCSAFVELMEEVDSALD